MFKPDNVDQFVIETVFNDKGASKGLDNLNRKQKTAIENNKALQKSSFSLGNAFRTIGAYIGIRELTKYADEWTNIKSILNLITETEEERVSLQNKLFKIANNTRQSMSSTADLYRRITTSTEELNLSEAQRLKIVEAINKALIIGGGSAAANEAALIQLGQGLASGQLRGEELNSILEQAPRLAQMIAEGLGVRVGDLRKIASEGGLTADKVLGAILNQASKVNEEFDKMGKTIGQAFTVFNNNFGKFINNLNEATGASTKFADLIIYISNNLEDLAKVVMIAAIPALKALTVWAWKFAKPFIKAYAVILLLLEALKMLKGDWNWYAEGIDKIQRGTQGLMNWFGEKTGLWDKRGFVGDLSSGETKGFSGTVAPEYRTVSPATSPNVSKSNVNQNVTINVNGSKEVSAVADEIENRLNSILAVGVLQ